MEAETAAGVALGRGCLRRERGSETPKARLGVSPKTVIEEEPERV